MTEEMPVTLIICAAAGRLCYVMEQQCQADILIGLGSFNSVGNVPPHVIYMIPALLVKAVAGGYLRDNCAENIAEFHHESAWGLSRYKAGKLAAYALG